MTELDKKLLYLSIYAALKNAYHYMKGKKYDIINMQCSYGIIAYTQLSDGGELWWLENGQCVHVPNRVFGLGHKSDIQKAARVEILDIEVW